MKFYKLTYAGKESWGIGKGDGITLIDGDMFSDYTETDVTIPLAEAKIVAPLINGYIIAVGANYMEHIKESNSVQEAPKDPVLFVKLPSGIRRKRGGP